MVAVSMSALAVLHHFPVRALRRLAVPLHPIGASDSTTDPVGDFGTTEIENASAGKVCIVPHKKAPLRTESYRLF